MREYNYRALAEAPVPNWGWELKDFRSQALRPVAERFLFNNIRISTFALMPAWIALEAAREQLWFDHASIKAGVALDPDLSNYDSPKITPELRDEFNRLVFEHRGIDKEATRSFLRKIGVTYVEYQLSWSDATRSSIDALFHAIILDSWTAFECLSVDLWKLTLDNESGELAKRIEMSGELRRPHKDLKPQDVRHNPKTEFGSYCLETRRLTLQTLEDIQRIYTATFQTQIGKLFNDVEGGYIHALAAFRNALIHRAGEADRKFTEDVQRFPEFRGISNGDKLLPDGEQVKKMRDASMFLGRQLIQVADSVLTPSDADDDS